MINNGKEILLGMKIARGRLALKKLLCGLVILALFLIVFFLVNRVANCGGEFIFNS